MTLLRNFTKYWLPVILWMGFIFWMSTATFSKWNTFFWVEKILLLLFPGISFEQAKMINFILRRAGHVTEYCIMALLPFRAFRASSAESWNWRWFWGALIVVVLWAALDEFHQSFVPARRASFMDVGLDASAGILALLICALWFRYKRNRKSNHSSP